MAFLTAIYDLLWGELFRIPLPGGSSLGVSLLVLILLPAGVYFTALDSGLLKTWSSRFPSVRA